MWGAVKSPQGVYISGQQNMDKLRPIKYVVCHIVVSSVENSIEQGRCVESVGKGSVISLWSV